MTAKAPTPMPEGVDRPKAPSGPPNKNDKPLIMTNKQKNFFVAGGVSIDNIKDEARAWGFNVILIIDTFEGPVKERINL